jgi:protein-S-isoprenylcysteine O-methyltransferase Ste14
LKPAEAGSAAAPAARISFRQAVGIPLNVLLFLLLMVMGWGSWDGFFAHPVRVGVVILHLAMIPVMTFWTSGRGRGIRHARDWPLFFPALVFHSLFTAWLLPYMDARQIWTLPGGDVTRWTGLLLLTLGAVWRLGPMMTLGRRFSSAVALQACHALHTRGFYAAVRHPSYLGILLMDLGFAGVFRSVLALALMPLVFWMFKRRMDVEEGFLAEQFGDDYRAYLARTVRLLPGVY